MATVHALINKNTLAHICKVKKVSSVYISEKTKQKIEQVNKWLNVEDKTLPTIRQAKRLAICLHVPFAGLYMNPCDIPYKSIPNIKNMRSLSGTKIYDDSALNIAIEDVLIEREYLLEELSKFDIGQTDFTFISPNEDSPIVWANKIRKEMGIELQEQYNCSSNRKFYLYLRNKIENRGVFVNCFTDVSIEDVRGFAVYYSKLPVIGINDNDRAPAKSFTLIHELVHLIKRFSSVCNDMINTNTTLKEEVFCNAVAGELLVPQNELKKIIMKCGYILPYKMKEIKNIADMFSVSREVIVRRLFDLGFLNQKDYDNFYSSFYEEREKEREEQRIARNNGIENPFRKNVVFETIDRVSSSISKILLKGYVEDVYSKQDIASYLGIKQKFIDKYLGEIYKWNN